MSQYHLYVHAGFSFFRFYLFSIVWKTYYCEFIVLIQPESNCAPSFQINQITPQWKKNNKKMQQLHTSQHDENVKHPLHCYTNALRCASLHNAFGGWQSTMFRSHLVWWACHNRSTEDDVVGEVHNCCAIYIYIYLFVSEQWWMSLFLCVTTGHPHPALDSTALCSAAVC